MTLSAFLAQLANGAASAASLFLVAAGLSLIFGVTRIVNFAHGSLTMLGAYLGYTLVTLFAQHAAGPAGYAAAIVLAALGVGVLGVVMEALLLRRLYEAPEMLQLTATFGVVLIVADATLAIWGPEDLLGPRAPGLRGVVALGANVIPQYDVLLMAASPLLLGVLWLLLHRTRWGVLVRAATEDREMTASLGVNQRLLFSSVFFLGAALAGLGGALQLPREPANLGMDVSVIADAFVVTVIGGLGSVPGAFVAALLIGVIKALCIGLGDVSFAGMVVALPKLTRVVEFVVMAIVLIVRPWGLFGRPIGRTVNSAPRDVQAAPGKRFAVACAVVIAVLALLPLGGKSYALVLATDIAIFALFATSLHLIMGPGGMVSFGHAAYFGIGAYAAALMGRRLPMEVALAAAPFVAGVAAVCFGAFAVRLRGVYLAMLTLAFAQIAWSVAYQWDAVTGGSNGLVGVWPSPLLAGAGAYFELTLFCSVAGILLIWHVTRAPFGLALRAVRDSPLRAEASGISVRRVQWLALIVAGAFAGLSGALYAFSKGSISPDTLGIPRSVDAIVMVLLGGLNTMVGPALGAAVLTLLQDVLARNVEHWRALVGVLIVLLVVLFPRGIAGTLTHAAANRRGSH